MTLRRYRLGFAILVCAFLAVSAWAYLGRMRLPPIEHIDLVGHALFFGGLGAFAHGSLGRRRVAGLPLGPTLVLLAAGAEELLQGLSPYRHRSWLDYGADVVGVAIGTLVVTWVHRNE